MLSMMLVISAPVRAVEITKVQVGQTYGEDNIQMENQHLRVLVAPYSGARVISFLWKDKNSSFAVRF
jgi:hypothetical protein